MKRVLLATVVAMFLLGACGDDDSAGGAGGGDLNAEEQQLASEISTELQSGEAEDIPLTAEEADCVGNGMVSGVGYDKLKDVDFTADEVTFALADDDAATAAGVMVDCIDIKAAMAKSFTEDGDISQESADCIAAKIDDDTMQALFAQIFTGNEDAEPPAEFTRVITEGMTDCLSDEELQGITG